MILACGHLVWGWPQVTSIGHAFPGAQCYCETCDDWIRLMRDATSWEIAGITAPLPGIPPDDPPF